MKNSKSIDANQQLIKARQLNASKSYAEAEQILLNLVAVSPDYAQAWHELGNARYKSKAYSKAVEAFQRRYGLEPNDPVANYSLGVALLELGRVDEARMYIKRALDIKPDFHQAKQRLVQLDHMQESSRSSTPQRASELKPEIISAQQNSTPLSPERELLSKDLQRGRTDPGKLIYEGKPLLRNYLGWLILSLLLVASSAYTLINYHDIFYRLNRIITPPAPYIFAGFGLLGVLIAVVSIASRRSTLYRIYERRIDVSQGLLRRTIDSIWLFEFTDVVFQQPIVLTILRTARILLRSEKEKSIIINGMGNSREMQQLWEFLRDESLTQRRDIKGIWI